MRKEVRETLNTMAAKLNKRLLASGARRVTATMLAEALGAVPGAGSITDPDCDVPHKKAQRYRAAAKELHGRDGEVEIDDGAALSFGDDAGTYVQAWVWVGDEDLKREAA